MRDMALLGLTPVNVLLSGSMLCRIVGESPLNCTLGLRDIVAVFDRKAGLARPVLVSHRAIQSSVRLRQRLSALRRTWRSDTTEPLMMELAEWSVPCGPALPLISANASASVAVDSRVRYTAGETCCLALLRASRSRGCVLLLLGVLLPTVDSEGDGFDLRCWFGEEDTVVAEVLTVRGRSAEAEAEA